MSTWRPFITLLRREAWEYRAWWTWVMGACILMGIVGLLGTSLQHPLAGSDVHAFRDTFFLRWCHGLFLIGAGILALSHAAHGVFDERQDRSIGFWQAWPVPERLRLLSKSTAIAAGWPLMAAVATTALSLFCMGRGLWAGEGMDYQATLAREWIRMMQACAASAACSWPIVCGWLWCSARAPSSPWAWGLGVAAAVYAISLATGLDGARVALLIALGPALPAASGALQQSAWLPWDLGSLMWGVSCIAGWLALCHAGRSIGDMAET